jgi:hypothetical protein
MENYDGQLQYGKKNPKIVKKYFHLTDLSITLSI